MFHSAFHLYFGAFDIILYAAAFLVSLSVSRAICDDMDVSQVQYSAVPITSVTTSDRPSANPSHDLTQTPPLSELTNVSVEEPVQQPVSVESEQKDHPESVAEAQETNVKPTLTLSKTKLYRLRKQPVVKLSDLAFAVPDSITRYQLRQQPVIRLTDLKSVAEVIP